VSTSQIPGLPPPQQPPQYPPQQPPGWGPDSPQQAPPPAPKQKRHITRKILIVAAGTFLGLIAVIVILAAALGNAANKAANPITAASTPAATAPASTPADTSAPADTSPPVPSGPAVLAMGDTETLGSNDTGATEGTATVSHAVIATQPADQYGSAPKNGYFVIVTVAATADQGYTGGYDVYSGDFYALSGGSHYGEGNGNSYDALADSSAELGYTTLAAGETTGGKLVFDVPARHGYIVYAPNLDGQPLAEWKY
jgi:hypothetical protein